MSDISGDEGESMLPADGGPPLGFDAPPEMDLEPQPSEPIAPDGRELPPLTENVQWIARDSWGAVPSIDPLPVLEKRPKRLYVCYTGGGHCDTNTKCVRRVKKLQKDHIKGFKLSDIAFNFVICGDGRVYEGRGFAAQPIIPGYEEYMHESYAVAYVGRFCKRNPMPWDLEVTGEEFLGWLYQARFLAPRYELIQLDPNAKNRKEKAQEKGRKKSII